MSTDGVVWDGFWLASAMKHGGIAVDSWFLNKIGSESRRSRDRMSEMGMRDWELHVELFNLLPDCGLSFGFFHVRDQLEYWGLTAR